MNPHRVFLRDHEFYYRGVRCYDKVGFRRKGTARESTFKAATHRDTHQMSMLRSEYEENG